MFRFPFKNSLRQIGKNYLLDRRGLVRNQFRTIMTPLETTASKDKQQMQELWPQLQGDIAEFLGRFDYKNIGVPHCMRMINYNVPATIDPRHLGLLHLYRKLGGDQNEEIIRDIQIMIWCAKMDEMAFYITDDIMDSSLARHGKPSWYKLDDIGLMAMNDSLLLQQSVSYLKHKHFKGKRYYEQLLEHSSQIIFLASFAQLLDNKAKNVLDFDMDLYTTMMRVKSHELLCLNLKTIMHIAELDSPMVFEVARDLIEKIGFLYMVQEDFLDAFGDPKIVGKVGSDIQKNKCTWLVVTYLERATDMQKQILAENYGSSDPVKVECVKQLYKDMGLIAEYRALKEDGLRDIQASVGAFSMVSEEFDWIVENLFRVSPYNL